MTSFRTWLENVEKKLIIMRGFPGSGKSTLAKQLGQSGVVYSTDDFFTSEQGKYQFNPALLGRNHQLNFDRTKKALEQGVSPVVIDNTNINARDIKPYVMLAREFGYTVEFREPETPWKFNAEELARRNTHGVPKAIIEKLLSKWRPLTPDDF